MIGTTLPNSADLKKPGNCRKHQIKNTNKTTADHPEQATTPMVNEKIARNANQLKKKTLSNAWSVPYQAHLTENENKK